MIAYTPKNAQIPDVPTPPGATGDSWDHSVTFDGVPIRGLEWFRRTAGKIGVAVDGSQTADGAYTCGISTYGEVIEIGAAEARELAAALVEAADVLDRLQ